MGPSEILTAFRALPLHRRHDAMRMACSYALEVWDRYAAEGAISYTDGVAGMQHMVDMTLPNRAIAAVDRTLIGDRILVTSIWEAYKEPITALQDGDLDFPDAIASAYYAIYNLYGFVFGHLKLYDDGEVVIEQAYTGDGFVEEWWTRTWDAWASRGTFPYPASELDPATFDAIANGKWPETFPENRLGAVLLALAGRVDEACALAARLFGIDDDGWLRRNIRRVACSDAIFVGDTYYAVALGDRYVVRAIEDNRLRLSGRCGGGTIRRFAISAMDPSNQLFVFAAESTDEIGTYETVLHGEELDNPDYGYRTELRGARTIVALGTRVELVAASDREVAILSGGGYMRLGDGRVEGGAFSEDGEYIVTWAGPHVALWNRTKKLLGMELAADIWHAVIANGRVLLALRGERGRFIDLPAA